MHSMAIKINVSHEDRDAINRHLEEAGYGRQRRKFHCTFGFIEKVIPKEEVHSFGQMITKLLQDYLETRALTYEVKSAVHLFGHVIAFEPTSTSIPQLLGVNQWLFEKVKEVSKGRFSLNEETTPQKYTPHLTLWRTKRPDTRFEKLNKYAETHPSYTLSEAAYVVF